MEQGCFKMLKFLHFSVCFQKLGVEMANLEKNVFVQEICSDGTELLQNDSEWRVWQFLEGKVTVGLSAKQ